MSDDTTEEEPEEYTWEWVLRVNGADGIGNYPATREALHWCVARIRAIDNEEGGHR